MTLSDKIIKRVARKNKEDPFMETIINTNDVKEFIKDIRNKRKTGTEWVNMEYIDKLAGSKLI